MLNNNIFQVRKAEREGKAGVKWEEGTGGTGGIGSLSTVTASPWISYFLFSLVFFIKYLTLSQCLGYKNLYYSVTIA